MLTDRNISESDPLVKVANITSMLIFQSLQYPLYIQWSSGAFPLEVDGSPLINNPKTMILWASGLISLSSPGLV